MLMLWLVVVEVMVRCSEGMLLFDMLILIVVMG